MATLEVHLKEARELKDLGSSLSLSLLSPKQACYCVLSCLPPTGPQDKQRSNTNTDGGKDPVWSQLFQFKPVTRDMTLKLEFFDERLMFRDRPIGESKVQLYKVFQSQERSRELQLPVVDKSGKERGTVSLSVTLKGGPSSSSGSKDKPSRDQATSFGGEAPKPKVAAAPAAPAAAVMSSASARPASAAPAYTKTDSSLTLSPHGSYHPLDSPKTTASMPLPKAQPAAPQAAAPPPPPTAPPSSSPSTSGQLPRTSSLGHVPSQPILPECADTNCWDHYERGKVLGKGTVAITYLATHKRSRQEYAVKVIPKRKLSTIDEIQDVQNEVKVMIHLKGHPNIVRLENVYEDKNDVCLVMELMRGGELFDAIHKKGIYSEKDAATLLRDIVGVVAKLHAESVIHRDVKPENFLLTDTGPNATLKMADFGLSCFYKAGQNFTDIVGSLYYMAPEVLRRDYGKAADVWSCGVILYILLSGRPPFGATGKNEHEVFTAIASEMLDLQSDPWGKISEQAKDCIRRMLKRDPKHRATAEDVLRNDWLKENGVAPDTDMAAMGVVTSIKRLSQSNKLTKAAAQMIVAKMPLNEIEGLRDIFATLDQKRTGRITLKQFAVALKQRGAKLSETELKAMWKAIDVEGDGTILYEEFISATVNKSRMELESRLKAAFIRVDLDGDGFITPDELKQGLTGEGLALEGSLAGVLHQVELEAGDSGYVDYNEFCARLRSVSIHMATSLQRSASEEGAAFPGFQMAARASAAAQTAPTPRTAVPPARYAVLQHNFRGDAAHNELSVSAGDRVRVLADDQPDWLRVEPEAGGKIGYVPRAYVEFCEAPERSSAPSSVGGAAPSSQLRPLAPWAASSRLSQAASSSDTVPSAQQQDERKAGGEAAAVAAAAAAAPTAAAADTKAAASAPASSEQPGGGVEGSGASRSDGVCAFGSIGSVVGGGSDAARSAMDLYASAMAQAGKRVAEEAAAAKDGGWGTAATALLSTSSSRWATMQYDFHGDAAHGELSVKAGAKVRIVSDDDPDWLCVLADGSGTSGFVPRNYTKPLVKPRAAAGGAGGAAVQRPPMLPNMSTRR